METVYIKFCSFFIVFFSWCMKTFSIHNQFRSKIFYQNLKQLHSIRVFRHSFYVYALENVELAFNSTPINPKANSINKSNQYACTPCTRSNLWFMNHSWKTQTSITWEHKSQCIQMGTLLCSSQDSLFITHDAQDTFLVLTKLPAFDTTNHPSTTILQENIYTYLRVYFCTVHDLHDFHELWTTRMSNQVK